MPAASPTFDIVVSAENTHFFLWQSLLFHYSCLTYQKQVPIFVVHHQEGEALLPGFELITRMGGHIQTAPSWRLMGGINYGPRNTLGTLKHVRTRADYTVLCDSDMIFRRQMDFSELPIGVDHMTFDSVFYLHPDREENQPILDDACRAAGVPPQWLRDVPMSGGVPHIISNTRREEIADEWLHCISYFPTHGPHQKETAGALSRGGHQGTQQWWLSIMWAALLMVYRLKLTPQLTEFSFLNGRGGEPLPPSSDTDPAMIHYCYAGPGFNKHEHDSEASCQRDVWRLPVPEGTVNGVVCRQLQEAAKFYGFSNE